MLSVFPLASRRVGLMRVVARFWLLAYLMVAAGAPVLDGVIGHEEPVAHWEGVGGGQCPASHAADDCHLCQLVQVLRASAGGPLPVLAVRVQPSPHAAAEVRGPGSGAALESCGPRGPPIA